MRKEYLGELNIGGLGVHPVYKIVSAGKPKKRRITAKSNIMIEDVDQLIRFVESMKGMVSGLIETKRKQVLAPFPVGGFTGEGTIVIVE